MKYWLHRQIDSLFLSERVQQEIKPVNLKEINPEYSLEGMMLKLQYFGHLIWRANSLKKTLMLGKIKSRRRRGWQRMRWTWVWASSGRRWKTGQRGMLQSMGSQRVGHDWVAEQQQHCWEHWLNSYMCCSVWHHLVSIPHYGVDVIVPILKMKTQRLRA